VTHYVIVVVGYCDSLYIWCDCTIVILYCAIPIVHFIYCDCGRYLHCMTLLRFDVVVIVIYLFSY